MPKIMKTIKQYSQTLLLTLPLLLSACGAYLDVNPKSEVTDKELFATAEGCEDAIYGIYAEIGGERNGLYGQMLAYKYPDLMTGNFTINQSDDMAYVVQRQWTHDNAIAVAEKIWVSGYKAIGHVNKALFHILPKDDGEFRHTRASCSHCGLSSISRWRASSPYRSPRATPRPKPKPFPM